MTLRRCPPSAGHAVRRLGLAVPTAIAALVCGGSVFAIGASGALALGDAPSRSIAVGDPLGAGGQPAPSMAPSMVPLMPASMPAPMLVPPAATGRVYSVAVTPPPTSPRTVSSGQQPVVVVGIDPPLPAPLR
jgi:hypothetical protein